MITGDRKTFHIQTSAAAPISMMRMMTIGMIIKRMMMRMMITGMMMMMIARRMVMMLFKYQERSPSHFEALSKA